MSRFMLPLALFATACSPNIGWRDHDPAEPHFLGKRNDHLAGPYAQGSTLTFWIDAGRELDGWTVTSSEPGVFEPLTVTLDEDRLKLVGTALAEGSSQLALHKPNGKVVETLPIEVRRPDRFELASLALLRVGSEPRLDDVQMLATRQVTLAVQAYDGAEPLGGNAGLRVIPPADDGLDLEVRVETREGADHPTYLKLDAPVPMERTLPLLWDDQVVLEPTIRVVDPSAIASVALEGSEAGANPGDTIRRLASARDADGERILGAQADWYLDADPQVSSGDLYTYDLNPRDTNLLVAQIAGRELTTTIAGRGSAAESSDIGCSTTGRSVGWVLLVGLLGLRRR